MQVVGSANTLGVDKRWKNLVQSARKRRCFFEVRVKSVTAIETRMVLAVKVRGLLLDV